MFPSLSGFSLTLVAVCQPPGARARVALTGLTVAEYFRDEEGQDVLLFIDNIFRFTQVRALASLAQRPLPNASCMFPRLVRRSPLCSVVFRLPSVTSQRWLRTWALFKSVLPQPRMARLLQYRQSTCQLMT